LWNCEIVGQSDRASAHHGFDDFPSGTVVVRERDLTRTTSVGCTWCVERHLGCLASLVCRFGDMRRFLFVVAFAGEVCAGRLQRCGVAVVFQVVGYSRVFFAVDGERIMHHHVS